VPGTESTQSDYDPLGIAAAQIIKAIISTTDEPFQQKPLIATEIAHNPREPPSQTDRTYESTPVHLSVIRGMRGTDLKRTHLQGQNSSRGLRNFMPKVLFPMSTQNVTISESPQHFSKHFRHPLRHDAVTGTGLRALMRAR